MDITGSHDIGELMALAEQTYDLSRMDAVLLLESESVEVAGDGATATTVHRIAWFNSELGSELYADLRVPYDTENETLEVLALRTWRDQTWWPDESEISPTAVVETTPHALASADDYLHIFEMMLLHDGVEIPCIVETMYRIVENSSGPGGADGMWIFAKADPAVRSVFTLTAREGEGKYYLGNAAPEPERIVNRAADLEGYVWTMDLVDRLSRPLIDDPLVYAPYVIWSTWEGWDDLAQAYYGPFKDTMVLNQTITDTLAERLEREPNDFAKVQVVADYVDETTRSIRYDDSYWIYSPRPAARTWETAYGHRTDRAVLAAALFAEADLKAEPIFVTPSPRKIHLDVPSLAWFENVSLVVSGEDLWTLYDPASGSLTHADPSYAGRTYWLPGVESKPQVYTEESSGPGNLEVMLTIEAGDEEWTGTGYFEASGNLSPFGRMVGLSGQSKRHIGGVLGGVFEGADVSDYNFIEFVRPSVAAGFSFIFQPEEPDDMERIRIEIGDPTGGIMDNLPAGVHAYSEDRDSPVIAVGPMSQKILVRVRAEDYELYHLPDEANIITEVGEFMLSVTEDDEWVTVTRELKLSTGSVPADQWPALRQLLLEEQDPENRTVLLKTK
jgi:hypothetical protein